MSKGSDYLDEVAKQLTLGKKQRRTVKSILNAFDYRQRRQSAVDMINKAISDAGLKVDPALTTTTPLGTYLIFSLSGTPAKQSSPGTSPRNTKKSISLASIHEVMQLTNKIEDSTADASVKAIAISVRSGLEVLKEYVSGKSDENLARATHKALQRWADVLKALNGYSSLMGLGLKLAEFLKDIVL